MLVRDGQEEIDFEDGQEVLHTLYGWLVALAG